MRLAMRGVAAHQRVQVLRRQHQQAGAGRARSRSPSGGCGAAPRPRRRTARRRGASSCFFSATSTSPAAMKYIECAASPSRTITSPGSTQLRAQKLHDVGDLDGVELGEQRHPRDHAPGDDEIAAVDLLGKGVGDDADRQRDHDQAEEDGAGGDDLAERGDRHHVAVADGADGHHRPPQRLGDGAELVRLHVAFGEMHQRGGDQRRPHGDHQAAEQRAPLGIEHVEQRAHRRRIARDLEEAHDAEDEDEAQVGGQHEGEPERQHRDEIDDAGRAQRVFQPRLHRLHVLVRPVLDRGPQPQDIFDGEDDERDVFDQIENELVARAVVRHRFERHGDEVDDDEANQQPVDEAAGAVADRALLEHHVDAPPQLFDRVA